MAKSSGGGGRAGRGIRRVAGNGLAGGSNSRLEARRAANVAQDKALFAERRTASPARRTQIDNLRQRLENERLHIDFGSRRAGELRA